MVDLFNKNGIVPTTKFRQPDSDASAQNNRMDAAGAVIDQVFQEYK